LSIRQPWATLILMGGKNVENRTWKTNWTGRLVIHASQKMDESAGDLIWQAEQLFGGPLPRGAFIGEVELYGWSDVEFASSEWATGPWCWLLGHPVAYKTPIPAKGKLGLFRVEDLP